VVRRFAHVHRRDDGRERTLATSEVQLGVPIASPDGSRAAVVEAVCSDRLIVAGDVLLVDRRPANLAESTPAASTHLLDWRAATASCTSGFEG